MPDLDPTQIIAVAQEEAKNANENLRAYLLAENKRLRNENKELSDLRLQHAVLKERAAYATMGGGTTNHWLHRIWIFWYFRASGVCGV